MNINSNSKFFRSEKETLTSVWSKCKKGKKIVVNVSNKTCRGIFIAVQIAIATQLDVLPLFIFFFCKITFV